LYTLRCHQNQGSRGAIKSDRGCQEPESGGGLKAFAWGDNSSWQLGLGDASWSATKTIDDVVALSAGSAHSLDIAAPLPISEKTT
jgi:hypothetical protein